MESFEVIREALCRFTYDRQLPDYGVLAHRVSEEFLVGDPLGVTLREPRSRQDVRQVVQITRHARPGADSRIARRREALRLLSIPRRLTTSTDRPRIASSSSSKSTWSKRLHVASRANVPSTSISLS